MPADLTPLIAELRRLHEKATPGPWLNAGYDRNSGQTVVAGKHKFAVCQVYGVGPAFTKPEGGSMSDDAALIAAMRNVLPALLDQLASSMKLSRDVVDLLELFKLLVKNNEGTLSHFAFYYCAFTLQGVLTGELDVQRMLKELKR